MITDIRARVLFAACQAGKPAKFDGVACSPATFAAILDASSAPRTISLLKIFGIAVRPEDLMPDSLIAVTKGHDIVCFAKLGEKL